MGDAAFIQASGVGLEYPNGLHALGDATLGVAKGEFVSIVGPSGCGKSTFLRLVAGLQSPTAGTLSIAGHSAGESRARRAVAFVFQQPTLLPWRTVRGNVALPGELGPSPRRLADAEVDGALGLVGLGEFAKLYPHQLSGGMQMRASLARALVTRPEVLLLDEPFAALDEITRQRLNEDLLGLWQRDGWTALFVTHNVAEAVFLGQRVLVMGPRPGRIVEEFRVPFAYPRAPELRAVADFARLCGDVSATLRRTAP